MEPKPRSVMLSVTEPLRARHSSQATSRAKDPEKALQAWLPDMHTHKPGTPCQRELTLPEGLCHPSSLPHTHPLTPGSCMNKIINKKCIKGLSIESVHTG